MRYCLHGGDGAADKSFRRRIATLELHSALKKAGTEVQPAFPSDTNMRGGGAFDLLAIFRCRLDAYGAPAAPGVLRCGTPTESIQPTTHRIATPTRVSRNQHLQVAMVMAGRYEFHGEEISILEGVGVRTLPPEKE